MYSQDWDLPSRPSPFSLTPWVRRLLIANAVVYLLSITVFTGPWFDEMFAFNPRGVLEQPWTIITYMFVHGDFLHLAFNLLMLFFFGSAVEDRMGRAAFARYFFFCGVGGPVLSLVLSSVWQVSAFYGASAAVLGVALAFAIYWPNAPIYIFPLPVPIKAKWLVIGMAGMDLVLELSRSNDGLAHLAHLGGFLFGYLYLRIIPRVATHTINASRERDAARVLVHPSAESAEDEEEIPPHSGPRDPFSLDEVDRVLDKISAKGMDSLTPAELRLLDEVSRQLRNN